MVASADPPPQRRAQTGYGRQYSGAQIAADLHTLLERADVPGPYVLAGHSFGGLYVQSFAAQFPDEVAGLVLLDSTAPKPGPPRPVNTDRSDPTFRVATLLPALAHLGAGRLMNPFSYTTLPPRSARQMATLSTNSLHRIAGATTHASLLDEEADRAAASQAIHDVVMSVGTSSPLPPH